MPATLPPLSRREFLATAGAMIASPSFGRAAELDPHRVAFLSDPHIGEKPDEADRGCNMADRLAQVVAEIAKLPVKPACAIVDGDLAHKAGTAREYEQFARLIEPLRTAGLPVHLGLGNHDNFTRFAAGLARLRPQDKPVEGKQVVVAELDRVNLFVLDSYDPKIGIGGSLGAAQLKWLAKALDARQTKPAVVCVHHQLQFEPDKNKKYNGLADSAQLWPLLKGRKHVKAFVFGHTHTWKLAEKDGIHLINLPAIGYPFAKAEVTGWVDALFTEKGVVLELHAIDPKHTRHGDKAELQWRKG
jgi:3',5'-cyclic AMP phosphodiesterase CpdA